MKMKYSIVIPAYNEEERLPSTLEDTLAFLDQKGVEYEVIVVDDGSSDGTAELVQKFAKNSPRVRLLTYPKNRGKGYAVRLGMLNARGNVVLYADADGATPIEEIERLQRAVDQGAEVVIGSRAMYSKETQVKTVIHRKILGRVFNGVVNFVVVPGIADTQCGFKMFPRAVAQDIFSRQRSEGFSFDVEVLFLAGKLGYKITEVPINWTNIPGSKVNLVKDSMLMLIDVFKFRLRDLFRGYKPQVHFATIPRES